LAAQAILVSDWLISKKSYLKPLCQMNQNMAGSILVMFLKRLLIKFRFANKYGRQKQFLFLIGRFLNNRLL
jgi:hypothetical protein